MLAGLCASLGLIEELGGVPVSNFALKMMNFALTMMTVDYHPVKKEDLEEIEEVVRSVEARPGGYLMPDE